MMSFSFVSYLRSDLNEIMPFLNRLREDSLSVWIDREQLEAGRLWKDQIRDAIRSGKHFIACFSSSYPTSEKTFMNEELIIAIDELRQRSHHTNWFIPLVFGKGRVPPIDIGAGKNISDIQYIDFNSDFDQSILKLYRATGHTPPPKKPQPEVKAPAKITVKFIQQKYGFFQDSPGSNAADFFVNEILRGSVPYGDQLNFDFYGFGSTKFHVKQPFEITGRFSNTRGTRGSKELLCDIVPGGVYSISISHVKRFMGFELVLDASRVA